MSRNDQRRWTRDEALAVLSLYCQIPFGRMHWKNPAIEELAERLDRTPSAVALKLVNFASFDPEHQERGVSGMRNASALDRQVWDEYYGNWEALSGASLLSEEADAVTESETEVMMLRRTRRGQAFFRRSVLAAHENRCCVTGITASELLRASHIVPWAIDIPRRLDPKNGLALNALHDAAFDRGLLTFDEDSRLVLAKDLVTMMPSDSHRAHFEQYSGQKMQLPARFTPSPECMAFHRENIFRN